MFRNFEVLYIIFVCLNLHIRAIVLQVVVDDAFMFVCFFFFWIYLVFFIVKLCDVFLHGDLLRFLIAESFLRRVEYADWTGSSMRWKCIVRELTWYHRYYEVGFHFSRLYRSPSRVKKKSRCRRPLWSHFVQSFWLLLIIGEKNLTQK